MSMQMRGGRLRSIRGLCSMVRRLGYSTSGSLSRRFGTMYDGRSTIARIPASSS